MSIQSYRPRFLITIKSNIKITDSVVSYDTIVLNDYLSDLGEIQVAKSITSPMASFSITIPDKPAVDWSGQVNDTLYGIVQIFDYIEIRFTHEPTPEIPIILRGLITDIRRTEIITETPSRSITITGNDLGVLFSNIKLISKATAVGSNAIIIAGQTLAELLQATNAVAGMSVKSFYEKVIDAVNKILLVMDTAKDLAGAPIQFKKDINITEKIYLYFNMFDPMEVQVWNIMAAFADTILYEMYLEDREDGTYFCYRPKPFKNKDGVWIDIDGNTAPTFIDVQDEYGDGNAMEVRVVPLHAKAIVSLDTRRTDKDIINYVILPWRGIALSEQSVTIEAMKFNESDGILEYENCKATSYGYRVFQRDYVHISSSYLAPVDDKNEPVVKKNKDEIINIGKARTKSVMEIVKDNVMLCSGSMTVRGNHLIKPGCYVRVHRGQFTYEVYVESVSHRIQPFVSFTTDITYIRSTEFLERLKSTASPYLLEGRHGVYNQEN